MTLAREKKIYLIAGGAFLLLLGLSIKFADLLVHQFGVRPVLLAASCFLAVLLLIWVLGRDSAKTLSKPQKVRQEYRRPWPQWVKVVLIFIVLPITLTAIKVPSIWRILFPPTPQTHNLITGQMLPDKPTTVYAPNPPVRETRNELPANCAELGYKGKGWVMLGANVSLKTVRAGETQSICVETRLPYLWTSARGDQPTVGNIIDSSGQHCWPQGVVWNTGKYAVAQGAEVAGSTSETPVYFPVSGSPDGGPGLGALLVEVRPAGMDTPENRIKANRQANPFADIEYQEPFQTPLMMASSVAFEAVVSFRKGGTLGLRVNTCLIGDCVPRGEAIKVFVK